MNYTKRTSKRKFEEMREISAEVGIVPSADGSARFQIGDTIAVAVVRGPRELHPKFMQDPKSGILRCHYDMISFSVPDRKRPGPSRRSTEISLVTKNSLLPVLDLKQFPSAVVDVFIQITQANAGTRCAGICAASMALAHAGIPMKDLISSISVGKVGDKVLIDLYKYEEDHEAGATDIPVSMDSNGNVTLLQLDGSVSKDELFKSLELAKKGCKEIDTLQRKTLRDFYGVKK